MPSASIFQIVKKPDVAVIGILIAVVAILAGARSAHYLFFHTLAELFAIVVSLSIFILTWTSHRYLANGYLIVLGAAYGAIGVVDIFHTLTFKGMNLFPGVSTNYPTQFWLTARYLEALALLCGPLVIFRKPNFFSISAGFAAIAAGACIAVMYQWFPDTFIDGVGLTPFKVYSEYVIIAMLLVGFVLLYRLKNHFEQKIFFLLVASLWLAVATEFCFTRYAGFYDFTNELGHYFRFLSVGLAFIAIVLSGVRQPLELIFRELEARQHKLDEVNANLSSSEANLKNQINLLSALLKNLPIGVFMVEAPSGKPLVANDTATRLLGRGIFPDTTIQNLAEVYQAYKTGSRDSYPPEEMPIVLGMSGVTSHVDDLVVEKPDGTKSLLEIFGSPVKDDQGRVWASLVSFADITERKQAELELARSKNRYQGILNNMTDAYWRVDDTGRIVEANQAICQLHGYSKEELLQMSISDFELIESAEDTKRHIETIMREGHHVFKSQHRCRDGRTIDVEISASLAFDAPGNIDAFHRDITERNRMESHIRQMAFHDSLTKLPNRSLLNDRLTQAMAASKRSGFYGAMMFLDLDNFKPLNDAHGHEVGDLLLIEAADRLKGCVRKMDTVARFGGDEFVVMISELVADKDDSSAQARCVAEKIRVALSEPYHLTIKHDGKADTCVTHRCTASIGVALFVNQGTCPDDVLKWADTAMYQAKDSGRDTFRIYGEELPENSVHSA